MSNDILILQMANWKKFKLKTYNTHKLHRADKETIFTPII